MRTKFVFLKSLNYYKTNLSNFLKSLVVIGGNVNKLYVHGVGPFLTEDGIDEKLIDAKANVLESVDEKLQNEAYIKGIKLKGQWGNGSNGLPKKVSKIEFENTSDGVATINVTYSDDEKGETVVLPEWVNRVNYHKQINNNVMHEVFLYKVMVQAGGEYSNWLEAEV